MHKWPVGFGFNRAQQLRFTFMLNSHAMVQLMMKNPYQSCTMSECHTYITRQSIMLHEIHAQCATSCMITLPDLAVEVMRPHAFTLAFVAMRSLNLTGPSSSYVLVVLPYFLCCCCHAKGQFISHGRFVQPESSFTLVCRNATLLR